MFRQGKGLVRGDTHGMGQGLTIDTDGMVQVPSIDTDDIGKVLTIEIDGMVQVLTIDTDGMGQVLTITPHELECFVQDGCRGFGMLHGRIHALSALDVAVQPGRGLCGRSHTHTHMHAH